MKHRAQWASRLGFILAAAGSAVGLGSIWKFPYVAAKNGGGVFLLLYIALSLTLGFVLMIAEILMGTLSRSSPVGAYREMGGRGWTWAGYMGVICGFLILSFYSVVGGWTIAYFVKTIDGHIIIPNSTQLELIFTTFVSSPVAPIVYHAIFIAFTALVVIAGVQKGIEQVSKYLMSSLLLLMFILIGRCITLDGAFDGVATFLQLDFEKVTMSSLLDAMGLAFFSLSIGMGAMMTYGSYVPRETSIVRSAISVISLTVGISLLAGIMVFSAIFAFGFNPGQGPGLTFVTMPAIFSQMQGGQFFGVLFFLLLFFAALTSAVSLLEVVVYFFMDEYHLPRPLITIIMTILMFILGCAASLSFGPWKSYTFFGKTIFDCLDYVTSNIMMPVGCLATSLVVGYAAFNRIKIYLVGINRFSILMVCFKWVCRIIAPVMIVVVLIQNL